MRSHQERLSSAVMAALGMRPHLGGIVVKIVFDLLNIGQTTLPDAFILVF